MQFNDLAAQQERIIEKVRENIGGVLGHGRYIMGPEVQKLETALCDLVGTKHCIGCASGTDALLMALMAKGVGPGDVIFTTPFTFIATAEVIALLGATPVFVDIALSTFNMDPDRLSLAIQAVKANDSSCHPLPSSLRSSASGFRSLVSGIIAVDLFGLPCNYARINAVAQDNGLFVIEDAAQGLGATYKGMRAGALAEVGCTSFFPAKPLGCYGDGGALFTDNDDICATLQSIRVHGKGTHKYDNARIGINGRLDTLQAAILLAKLEIFPEEIDLRDHAARRYEDLLGPIDTLSLPTVPDGYWSVWAQYSVLAENGGERDKAQAVLKENGIPTAVYYPKPLHLQSAFAGLGYKKGDFPVSEDASNRIFSLPMHPYLTEEDQQKIADTLRGL